MKNLLLTCAVFLLALPGLSAQQNRSAINISLTDNAPLMVELNRRSYQEEGRVLTIGNLPSGRHRVRIFKPRRRGRVLVYEGTLRIESGTISDIVVDPFRETMRVSTRRYHDAEKISDKGINDDRYAADDRSYSDGSVLTREQEELQVRVEALITDSEKLKAMKSSLDGKTYNTGQVELMLQWLGFDSSRLEFAKWAQERVTDKNNYGQLESAFSFTSTKEEFREFMADK